MTVPESGWRLLIAMPSAEVTSPEVAELLIDHTYDPAAEHVEDDCAVDLSFSDRGALSASRLVGFPGPPSEPDVQLRLHPALHVFMPLSVQRCVSHVPAARRLGGRAAVRRYSPAASVISSSAANTLDPFAM